MAFGIFMGILPIWGFQLLAAVAGAYFLRLNKALVILFANISIPPNIPVILFLSYECGRIWMGSKAMSLGFNTSLTLENLQRNAIQYFFGAATLAVAAGLVFGLSTYLALKVRKYFANKP